MLTEGEKDKLLLHSAEVITIHRSWGKSRSPFFQILSRQGNIKSGVKCMYWVRSQEKHLKHWLVSNEALVELIYGVGKIFIFELCGGHGIIKPFAIEVVDIVVYMFIRVCLCVIGPLVVIGYIEKGWVGCMMQHITCYHVVVPTGAQIICGTASVFIGHE